MKNVDFDKLFSSFSSVKIGVIGDIMLDTYLWGHVDRISPEAPVPIVTLDKKEQRIGGAGNVAFNLAALGAKATMLSVVGQDENGILLSSLLKSNSINDEYLINSTQRLTTNKSRIISRNQQMIRLDSEVTDDLTLIDEDALLKQVQRYIEKEKPAVIIFEDYNKGILTQRIIEGVISLCKKNKVLTAVDPKRKNFFAYQGVDIFKPNLKEVKEGLNLLLNEINVEVLNNIHLRLHEKLEHQISLITLSEKGVFYCQENNGSIIPSHFRNIADVSGAGDTVIAVASLIYATTQNIQLMAEVANIAGGLVCEEVGTAAINKQKLLDECKLLLPVIN